MTVCYFHYELHCAHCLDITHNGGAIAPIGGILTIWNGRMLCEQHFMEVRAKE